MHKLSKYIHHALYGNTVLLYNALTDIVVPIEKNDFVILQKFFDNLDSFKVQKPKLYDKFIDWGFIIPINELEIDYIRYKNKKEIFNTRFYRLTINPTLDCNMSCWYCTVDAAGVTRPNQRMNDTIVESIKKYITFLVERKNIDGLFLDWFGGEPMLYFNEVIKPISLHAKALVKKYNLGFTHHITSNGYLIDNKIINEFNEILLNSFQITIDGNKEKHNKVRKHFGQSSYDKILTNINALCENIENIKITLRINYDNKTLNGIKDIIPSIKKHNRNKIDISFQKVFQIKTAGEENKKLLEAKKEFEKAGFTVSYWAYRPQSFFTCYSDKYSHAVINYDGNVFKCTARDYSNENKVGELGVDGIIKWDEMKLAKMFSNATFENEVCLKCNMLPLCFGPCIQKTYEVKEGKAKFKCLIKDAELSLNTFIISKAIKRKLIEK